MFEVKGAVGPASLLGAVGGDGSLPLLVCGGGRCSSRLPGSSLRLSHCTDFAPVSASLPPLESLTGTRVVGFMAPPKSRMISPDP